MRNISGPARRVFRRYARLGWFLLLSLFVLGSALQFLPGPDVPPVTAQGATPPATSTPAATSTPPTDGDAAGAGHDSYGHARHARPLALTGRLTRGHGHSDTWHGHARHAHSQHAHPHRGRYKYGHRGGGADRRYPNARADLRRPSRHLDRHLR